MALVAAPLVAATDLLPGYTPFLLLRLWVVGFSLYGVALARQGEGRRRQWQVPYVAMGAVFALVSGLDIGTWALIDGAATAMVAASVRAFRAGPWPPA